jgi:hypothetical protein
VRAADVDVQSADAHVHALGASFAAAGRNHRYAPNNRRSKKRFHRRNPLNKIGETRPLAHDTV